MYDYLKEICTGTWSLLVGLAITFKYFFKPVVTVQYPRQTLTMPPRFRGHTELIWDEKEQNHRCIVCMSCQRICPSGCITVEGERLEGAKQRSLSKYTLNFTRCSLCGQCVEVCPTNALDFSKEYNLAGPSSDAYIYDLLARVMKEKK